MFIHMRANWLLILALPAAQAALADDVCNPPNLLGPYAFQLTGATGISGTPQPSASLGRVVFDGRGNLSGTASATFSGFLLGNPVTGSYEAKSDCSVTWKLQDDSGAFQNFAGKLSADGSELQFRQTDPGAGPKGIMKKTPETCSAADLSKRYTFEISGSTTPMKDGDAPPHAVAAKGTLDVAENGSFRVESDCGVRFDLKVADPDGQPTLIGIRGFLVSGGKEILAFQTDPGAMVAGRFHEAAQ